MSLRINPSSRWKDCGYTYTANGIFSLSTAHSPTATYIPTLYAGEHGYDYFLAFLAHNIAQQTEHTESTKSFFVDLLNHGGLYFRQNPDATSLTDAASRRAGNGTHTYPSSKYGRDSICPDTEQNRKFIDSLLNAILKYGAEVLGVPEDNLVLTRFDARLYEILASLGDHNDTPNATDNKKLRLRMCIKIGGQTKVVFTLYRYNDVKDNKPAKISDAQSLEFICPEGLSVYATSAFASGHLPLAVDGDSDDGSYIIPYHRVEKVEGGRSITWVVDYWLDSVKAVMVALERIRKVPFHLDFNGREYVEKYYNVYNVKESTVASATEKSASMNIPPAAVAGAFKEDEAHYSNDSEEEGIKKSSTAATAFKDDEVLVDTDSSNKKMPAKKFLGRKRPTAATSVGKQKVVDLTMSGSGGENDSPPKKKKKKTDTKKKKPQTQKEVIEILTSDEED